MVETYQYQFLSQDMFKMVKFDKHPFFFNNLLPPEMFISLESCKDCKIWRTFYCKIINAYILCYNWSSCMVACRTWHFQPHISFIDFIFKIIKGTDWHNALFSLQLPVFSKRQKDICLWSVKSQNSMSISQSTAMGTKMWMGHILTACSKLKVSHAKY